MPKISKVNLEKRATKVSRVIDKLNDITLRTENKRYKERIKTSIICILLYMVIVYLTQNTAMDEIHRLAFFIAGAIFCLYNTIKSILSIRDKEYVKTNIVLLIFQGLFITYFISKAILLGGAIS